MNKIATPAVALAMCCVMMVSCSNDEKRRTDEDNTPRITENDLRSRDSIIGDMETSFEEIESELALIRQKENLLSVQSSGEMDLARKDQIITDIRLLNTLIENNKQKIAEYEKKLQGSGAKNATLNKRLKELQTNIASIESDNTRLREEIETRKAEYASVVSLLDETSATLQKRESRIKELSDTAYTAYYILGTRSELKENNVISRTGGVLGMGKISTTSPSLDEEKLIPIDIRTTRIIYVDGKKPQLISAHPGGSWEWVKDDDENITAIRILQPAKFWRNSKYLVVEVR